MFAEDDIFGKEFPGVLTVSREPEAVGVIESSPGVITGAGWGIEIAAIIVDGRPKSFSHGPTFRGGRATGRP